MDAGSFAITTYTNIFNLSALIDCLEMSAVNFAPSVSKASAHAVSVKIDPQRGPGARAEL